MEMKEEQALRITGYRTLVCVWAALLLLLAATVAVSKMTGYGASANLLIASVKAGLVLIFFMRLRTEGSFLKWMLLLTLSALTAIMALTFSDVWYR